MGLDWRVQGMGWAWPSAASRTITRFEGGLEFEPAGSRRSRWSKLVDHRRRSQLCQRAGLVTRGDWPEAGIGDESNSSVSRGACSSTTAGAEHIGNPLPHRTFCSARLSPARPGARGGPGGKRRVKAVDRLGFRRDHVVQPPRSRVLVLPTDRRRGRSRSLHRAQATGLGQSEGRLGFNFVSRNGSWRTGGDQVA